MSRAIPLYCRARWDSAAPSCGLEVTWRDFRSSSLIFSSADPFYNGEARCSATVLNRFFISWPWEKIGEKDTKKAIYNHLPIFPRHPKSWPCSDLPLQCRPTNLCRGNFIRCFEVAKCRRLHKHFAQACSRGCKQAGIHHRSDHLASKLCARALIEARTAAIWFVRDIRSAIPISR